jgi:transcriptional regulator of acetoin/glycerol metabolism
MLALSVGIKKSQVEAALEKYSGRIGATAAELGCSPVTLYRLLDEYELRSQAETLRADARIHGPRKTLGSVYAGDFGARADDADKAEQYYQALVRHGWNNEAARKEFDLPRRTWYREIGRLGVKPTAEDLKKQEQEIKERRINIINALQLENGVKLRAATRMGVPRQTFDLWCKQLKIDTENWKK